MTDLKTLFPFLDSTTSTPSWWPWRFLSFTRRRSSRRRRLQRSWPQKMLKRRPLPRQRLLQQQPKQPKQRLLRPLSNNNNSLATLPFLKRADLHQVILRHCRPLRPSHPLPPPPPQLPPSPTPQLPRMVLLPKAIPAAETTAISIRHLYRERYSNRSR